MTDAQAVAALPEAERRVFTLRKVYGYNQHEIAMWLHITDGDVDRLLRAGFIAWARSMRTSA